MGRMLLRPLTALLLAAGLAAASLAPAAADHDRPRRDFDLQAHRGGLGLVVESTLPAFANALELGVSTLELDVQITRDGEAVVTHDRRISDRKCRDTAPATPGDPQYPTSAPTSRTSPWPRCAPWTAAPRPCRSTPASGRPPANPCRC